MAYLTREMQTRPHSRKGNNCLLQNLAVLLWKIQARLEKTPDNLTNNHIICECVHNTDTTNEGYYHRPLCFILDVFIVKIMI